MRANVDVCNAVRRDLTVTRTPRKIWVYRCAGFPKREKDPSSFMRTYVATPKTIDSRWHVIDADGQVLGRVATLAAKLLQGKHKADLHPFIDTGDHVVIVNAAKVKLTGRKEEQKLYRRHSGYEGGLREERAKIVRQAKPDPHRRGSGARHASENNARRRDVPQVEGLRRAGTPTHGPEAIVTRGRISCQSQNFTQPAAGRHRPLASS